MLPKSQMVAVRKAIESTYFGKCTVIEHQKIKNNDGSTGFKEVIVLQNQPCKLSFESKTTANPTTSASSISQTTKLFLAPEIKIEPGSKIIVEQDYETVEFKSSGKPANYNSHQEVMLDLFDRWS